MRIVKLSEVNKEVKVVDGELFFADTAVRECRFITDESVAALYVVRVKEGENWMFETGFDLSGGKFWLGGIHLKWRNMGDILGAYLPPCYFDEFSSVKKVLDNLSVLSGKEWAIFEEGDLEAAQAAWDEPEDIPEIDEYPADHTYEDGTPVAPPPSIDFSR